MKILDLITSNVDLSGLEVETADDSNRAFMLKRKLTAYLNNSRGTLRLYTDRLSTITKLVNCNGTSKFKLASGAFTDRIFCFRGLNSVNENN